MERKKNFEISVRWKIQAWKMLRRDFKTPRMDW